jgi:AraC-like DNA-binding protein
MVHTADGILPEFFCPTSHYHGLTIVFFMEESQTALASLFAGVDIDLRRLRDKFCGGKPPFLLPKEKIPCSLFSPLYEMPQFDGWQMQNVKLLEILIYLSGMDISGTHERPYYYKTQVEKVKAIERYMTDNLGATHTIERLSARFDFPPTSMMLCFNGVFGSRIYAYLRGRRMRAAEKGLRETNDRVADIAASVGYENASKFAGAFRAYMDTSPNEYRKQNAAIGAGDQIYGGGPL